jgi:hypothetical protein
MLGLIPFTFRFRGKVNRLLDIYDCLRANSPKALHPTQIARLTGLGFAYVNARLEATPELYVKLPKRPDGITRYRLTSTVATQTPEEVEALVKRAARKESLLLYAVGAMVLCCFIIVVILIGPTL